LARLRAAAASARSGVSLDISDWISTTRRCGSGCVQGRLDVVPAVNTLLRLSGSSRTISGDEASALKAAARRASYRVLFSHDHLLRALDLDVDIGFDAPTRLRQALGALVGARIHLELGVAHGRR
jgi:hypothetical protein